MDHCKCLIETQIVAFIKEKEGPFEINIMPSASNWADWMIFSFSTFNTMPFYFKYQYLSVQNSSQYTIKITLSMS